MTNEIIRKNERMKKVLIVDDVLSKCMTEKMKNSIEIKGDGIVNLGDYYNSLYSFYREKMKDIHFNNNDEAERYALMPIVFHRKLQEKVINLQGLISNPFNAETVLSGLEHADYDVLLLDLGFPVQPEGDDHGGVVVAKVLQEKGKKFTFFTYDYNHGETNLKKAIFEGVLSEDDLESALEQFNPLMLSNYRDSSPMYAISKRGNLVFGGVLKDRIYEPNDKDVLVENIVEIVRKADTYQNEDDLMKQPEKDTMRRQK